MGKIIRFKASDLEISTKLEIDEEQEEEHFFGGVPIIEYRSNGTE